MTETKMERSNSSSRGQDWDLSWYECLIKFEDKQRERRNKILLQAEQDKKNGITRPKVAVVVEETEDKQTTEEDSNAHVTIPSLILKQMEVVKEQMTEYNDMMELLELTMGKNDKLQMEIETIRNENKGLQKQIDMKVAKKEEQIQQINDQFSLAQSEKEKLRKKLMLSKKKEEMLKRKSEKTIKELELLRRLNQERDSISVGSDSDMTGISDSILSRTSRVKSPSYSSDQLLKSVAKLLSLSDDDEDASTESLKTRSEKKKILKYLIQNLQEEGSRIDDDDHSSVDDSMSISSNKSNKNHTVSNKSTTFFNSFLTALQEEHGDEEDTTNKTSRPRPRSSV